MITSESSFTSDSNNNSKNTSSLEEIPRRTPATTSAPMSLDAATQAAIEKVVQTAITAVFRSLPQESRKPSNSFGFSDSADPADDDVEGETQRDRWNLGDIGFFDPNYENKSASTDQAIEHAGKDTYYRNVHVFIEKVKKMTIVLKIDQIRRNLTTCFKETIFI